MLSIPGFSDPVSSLTHLAGAVTCAVLGGFLIASGRGEARRVAALSVFVISCVLLLSLSGVYHLLTPETAARTVLMRLDHAAIFVLIAGSFTPVHMILLRERWQLQLLMGIWGAAIAGLTLKMVFFDVMPTWFGLLMYLGLGWMGLISAVAVARRFGVRFILPLVSGALAYTIGALIDFLDWPVLVADVIGPHELFHLAVLAGIAFHWAFIRSFARGERAGEPEAKVATPIDAAISGVFAPLPSSRKTDLQQDIRSGRRQDRTDENAQAIDAEVVAATVFEGQSRDEQAHCEPDAAGKRHGDYL
jgi:channel protein (hemolysin III family)